MIRKYRSISGTCLSKRLVAYDLKLLIDKGIYDVLKPAWIIDSIELGHTAPFQKKYIHDYDSQH